MEIEVCLLEYECRSEVVTHNGIGAPFKSDVIVVETVVSFYSQTCVEGIVFVAA